MLPFLVNRGLQFTKHFHFVALVNILRVVYCEESEEVKKTIEVHQRKQWTYFQRALAEISINMDIILDLSKIKQKQ